MKTLYDELGVPRDATTSDIKRIYRHSLNQHIAGYHDRPARKKDQLRLLQMREAYLTLSSPVRRLEYDLKLVQREQARLRRLERMGTIAGLVLLLTGLALMGHGYVRMQQTESADSAQRVLRQATVLASKDAAVPVGDNQPRQ